MHPCPHAAQQAHVLAYALACGLMLSIISLNDCLVIAMEYHVAWIPWLGMPCLVSGPTTTTATKRNINISVSFFHHRVGMLSMCAVLAHLSDEKHCLCVTCL